MVTDSEIVGFITISTVNATPDARPISRFTVAKPSASTVSTNVVAGRSVKIKLPASSVTTLKTCSGRSRLTSLSRAPTSEDGGASEASVVTLTVPLIRPVNCCASALGTRTSRLNVVGHGTIEQHDLQAPQ